MHILVGQWVCAMSDSTPVPRYRESLLLASQLCNSPPLTPQPFEDQDRRSNFEWWAWGRSELAVVIKTVTFPVCKLFASFFLAKFLKGQHTFCHCYACALFFGLHPASELLKGHNYRLVLPLCRFRTHRFDSIQVRRASLCLPDATGRVFQSW